MRELSNAETGAAFHEQLMGFLGAWVRGDLLEEDAVLGPWIRQLEWLNHVDDLALCTGDRTGAILLQLVNDDLACLPLAEPVPRGRGVVVGRVDEAIGMAFEVVFLLGVNRGQFPKQSKEDPLLPDTERSRLFNDLGYPLTIRANEHAHEKLLFILTALSASSRFFVLYHHSSYAGKPESESLFVPLFFGERAMERARVIPGNVEQQLQSVAGEECPPLTTREAMILMAKAPRTTRKSAERLAMDSGGVFWEFLRHAGRVAEDRNGRAISSHDFAVEGTAATIQSSLRAAGAWLDMEKCPYRFFLGRVLRIPKLKQPEALWSLSVLDEGSIVHKFFECLFHKGIPEAGDESEAIGSALREAVAWYHASHPEADLSALSAYQISRTEEWLLPVAEREIALLQREREESGFPDRILVEYTPSHASLTSTVGDERRMVTIPLSIRVDRMDIGVDENGRVKRSRLIDYKVRSQKKSRGRDAENLQLYLYAEALAVPSIGRPDAAYVEFFSGHEPDTVTMLSQSGDDDLLNTLCRQKVERLLAHLHRGYTPLFLTAGREHECSWCDYRWYCKRYDFVLTRKSDEASNAFFAELKDLNNRLRKIHKESITERYR
jgi:hypothetical protein